MNGGCTISSSPSHLDDRCLLFSSRLDESLERRQSTLSRRSDFSEADGQQIKLTVCSDVGRVSAYAATDSTMNTCEAVGIKRRKAKPVSLRRFLNSTSLRSRAAPNIAIIWVSTR